MAEITVDITAREENDLIAFIVQRGDESVSSILDASKVDTAEKMIEWAANQAMRTVTTPDIQKRITATIHQETGPDGDSWWFVDSIDNVQPIPRDAGRTAIEASEWATWTAQQAADWIDINVVDLDSAKTSMESMAKMLVYLRQMTVGE